jgi:hypothetical protein
MTAGPDGVRGSGPNQQRALAAQNLTRVVPIRGADRKASPRAKMAQATRAVLLASAIAVTSVGLRSSRLLIQGAPTGAFAAGISNHRMGADDEQSADIAIALLADAAEALFAAARVLPWHQAQLGGELPARAEARWVGHRRPIRCEFGNYSDRCARRSAGTSPGPARSYQSVACAHHAQCLGLSTAFLCFVWTQRVPSMRS